MNFYLLKSFLPASSPNAPKQNLSQEHHFKANSSHPWNEASLRNSMTLCKLPSPAESACKSPFPFFLFTLTSLFSLFAIFSSPSFSSLKGGHNPQTHSAEQFKTWHCEGSESAGRKRESISEFRCGIKQPVYQVSPHSNICSSLASISSFIMLTKKVHAAGINCQPLKASQINIFKACATFEQIVSFRWR